MRQHDQDQHVKAELSFILIALVAAALLSGTRLATANRIAANEASKAAAIRAELLGAEGLGTDATLCQARATGYAGAIQLIIGTDSDDNLLGVRVTRHSETPGIGDFIDRRNGDWITQFAGQPANIAFSKGFFAYSSSERLVKLEAGLDAVTGATVTRRAVIRGVAQGCTS